MQKRYGALQTISILFKILGVIIIGIGLTSGILSLLIASEIISIPRTSFLNIPGFSDIFPLGAGIITFLFSIIFGLFMWGIAELIICVIDIEYNTRKTAYNTRNIENKEVSETDNSSFMRTFVPPAQPKETVIFQGTPTSTPPSDTKENKSTITTETHEEKIDIVGKIKSFFNQKLW
jgi:quaternary ammonium compound-resistance protein SugE